MKAFIDDHRAVYGVAPICKVLPIAPSKYRLHAARQAKPSMQSARARRDQALMPDVERVWQENFRVYGVRKVWRQLQREEVAERLMRRLGLRGAIRGKGAKTTIRAPNAVSPLDHVRRQFRADRPNALWVSDFTFVSTWQGLRLRGLRHRRVCPPHRRLEGLVVGADRLRARCAGGGAACPQALRHGSPDSSQRPWVAVRADLIHRAPGRCGVGAFRR